MKVVKIKDDYYEEVPAPDGYGYRVLTVKELRDFLSDTLSKLTAALAERDEARERVKELEAGSLKNLDRYNMVCTEKWRLEQERDALTAQLDTAWQQSAEAFREAAAEEANEWAYGYVTEDTAPCRVGDKLRALPVPERKEG